MTTNSVATSSQFYSKLKRVIFLDSYRKGAIEEISLDGHTNLNGVNGTGKTSLLRLIPIFFGAKPASMVKINNVNKPFVKFYLPNDTSYFVFEYERNKQTCMVIIYKSANGESLNYRFIDKAYDVADFTCQNEAGETLIVSAKNIKKHINTIRSAATGRAEFCSSQIETCEEYKAIIQNQYTGKMSADNMRLMSRFSLCPSGRNNNLKDMDKIAAGMLSRSVDFAELKDMLISCIHDAQSTIELSVNSDALLTWHKDYSTYVRMSDHRQYYDDLRKVIDELTQLEKDTYECHYRLRQISMQLEREKNLALENHKTIVDELEAEEARYQTELEELTRQEVELRLALTSKTDKITDLEAKNKYWGEQSIGEKEAEVKQLGHYQKQLETASDEHQRLTIDSIDITTKFDNSIAAKNHDFTLLKHAIVDQQTEQKDLFNEKQRTLTSESSKATEALRQEFLARKGVINEMLHEIAGQLGAIDAKKALKYSCPEKDRLIDEKSIILDGYKKDKESLTSNFHKTAAEIKKIEQEGEKSARERQALENKKRQAEELLRTKELQLNAGINTLLGFLRQHKADWTQDIAKVIKPDLLLRTDLHPQIQDDTQGLYGVAMQLDHLDADPSANSEALIQEIADIRYAIDALLSSLSTIDNEASALKSQMSHFHKLHQEDIVKIKEVESLITKTYQDIKSLKDQNEQENRDYQKRLSDEEKEVLERKKDVNEKQQDLMADEALSVNNAKVTYQDMIKAQETKRDEKIKQLQDLMNQQTEAHKNELSALELEKQESLKANKVDIEAINASKLRIDKIKADIKRIQPYQEIVWNYQQWAEHEWAHYAKLQQEKIDFALAKQVAYKKVQELKEKQKTARDEGRKKVGDLNKLIGELSKNYQSIEILSGRINVMPKKETACIFDQSHTVFTLKEEFNRIDQTYDAKSKNRETLVNKFKNIILTLEGNVRFKFFNLSESTLDDVSVISMVTAWYETNHREAKGLINSELRLQGHSLDCHKSQLKDFDEKIKSFSHKLSDNIDSNAVFDKISKISFKLISKVRELGYWSDINTVSELYTEWAPQNDGRLPSKDLADAIKLISEHPQLNDKDTRQVSRLFDFDISVMDNGAYKRATNSKEMKEISSTGLSFIILSVIYVGLCNMIRRDQNQNILMPVDELKDLSMSNIAPMMDMFDRNNITMISAFPDPDPDTLQFFKNFYMITENKKINSIEIDQNYFDNLSSLLFDESGV